MAAALCFSKAWYLFYEQSEIEENGHWLEYTFDFFPTIGIKAISEVIDCWKFSPQMLSIS